MEWYRRWFNEEYLLVYEHRDREEAEREVGFIARTLGIDGGELVLDLCCGSGRHALPLSMLGCRVIGLDYSLPLLRVAREEKDPGAEWPCYIRADARNIPLREGVFDIVLSLFTSFGYFDDCGNRELLRSIARLLHRGGQFLIDYLNPSRIMDDLVPETIRERDGTRILEQRTVNRDIRRVEKTITLCQGNEEKVFWESVRLYSLDEMHRMLENSGLTVEETFGSFAGESYSESSPRMILRGKKNTSEICGK